MRRLIKYLVIVSCCFASLALHAQLLPNNKTLNGQSVARWMQSNRAMAELVSVLDAMNATPEAAAAFDALPALEQDQRINSFLQEHELLAKAQEFSRYYGWQSVGEYMRLGSRLGNAIAAYFLQSDLKNLPEEAAKAMREKADPAVLAVPATEIAFVKANEQTLQQYIKAYAAGR
jgi:hypothetical protein